MNDALRRRYPLLYVVWSLVCALLWTGLDGLPDPSRPSGRLTPEVARAKALVHLREFDAARFDSYHVIDAGVYRDPKRDEKVWVVLCDATPRSALARAVVVDLDAATGATVRVRRPVGVMIEEFPIP